VTERTSTAPARQYPSNVIPFPSVENCGSRPLSRSFAELRRLVMCEQYQLGEAIDLEQACRNVLADMLPRGALRMSALIQLESLALALATRIRTAESTL
jgi:hypothetical protein